MSAHDDYYARLPPRRRRHEGLVNAARIETALMVEFLSDARPPLEDATWVRNALRGPSPRGIADLGAIQERYGACHVTTGDAVPASPIEVGIYVRSDVLYGDVNLLREYLSDRP